MDPWVRCHGMKANPTGYLWSKYECFLMSGCQDMDLSKTKKWRDGNDNGNSNADAKVTTIALPVLCSDTYCIHIFAITLLLPFKKLVLVLMLSKAWRNSQSKAV